MPLSFPSNPTLNQQSTQNGRVYQWNGYTWDLINNIGNHASSHATGGNDPISISSSQVTDFNSSVSGLVSGVYAPLNGAIFTGQMTAPSGSFTNQVSIASNTITSGIALNIINSSNLYLWSNFR